MQQSTEIPASPSGPSGASPDPAPARPGLVTAGLLALAALAVATQVVNEVAIPPLVVFAVLLTACGILTARRPGRAWPRVSAALAALFLAVNAPYVIEDVAHPESFLGYSTSGLVVLVSLMTVAAGLGSATGRMRYQGRRLATTTGFLAIAAIVPAAVAASTVEDESALASDVGVTAENGSFTPRAEVSASGALFVRNQDRYRHTLVIEGTGLSTELPAFAGRRLQIDLDPGEYRYFCDVPGHDMEGTLVVGDTRSTEAAASNDTSEEATVKRTPVNPWPWSVELGFNQAEIIEGHTRELVLSGQSAMSADGRPLHAGDLAAQISMSLDNLEAVLTEAGMDLSNVVRLNIYTTDVDQLFANYGIIAERLGAAGVAPPGSLLGVARLAYPELMVELEATAAA